ncbi:4195_t:CDS:2, partial [Funneliformis mosseae]
QMAKAIQKIYNNPNDPLNPLEDFIIDKDIEYMGKYAKDFHLPLTDRSRIWFKELHINDDIYNNTLT